MLPFRIVLLVVVGRVISEQCFSDTYGLGDEFCLSDNYNNMVVPVDEAVVHANDY